MKNFAEKIRTALLLALFCSPFASAYAENGPVYNAQLKFSDFLTSSEADSCFDLEVRYAIRTPGLCKQAYAEYKLARQLSFPDYDHETAVNKFHNQNVTLDLIRLRCRLESNDPTIGQCKDYRDSKFNALAFFMLNKNQSNYHGLLGAFKRMYDQK